MACAPLISRCSAADIPLLILCYRSAINIQFCRKNKDLGGRMVSAAEEIALQQRESADEDPFSELAPEPEPALPVPSADPARPRGRPWAKGQSGNPAGRPPGIHPPAAVAASV